MKPAAFTYLVAESAAHAVDELGRWDGEAKVIAGGQSLVPLMNLRLAVPEALVEISRLDELSEIRSDDDAVEIGAAVTQSRAEDSSELARSVPLLRAALRHVAHREIRNAGTVCGSLAHADPSAELPAVAVTLDAVMMLRGPDGVRYVPAEQFFVSFFTTDLADDEILEAVRFPLGRHNRLMAFEEVATRQGDFAIAGVAAALDIDEGRIRGARCTALGVADVPSRLGTAEEMLAGVDLDVDFGRDLLGDVASAAMVQVDPPTDLHGSADYRRSQVGVLLTRVLSRMVDEQRQQRGR